MYIFGDIWGYIYTCIYIWGIYGYTAGYTPIYTYIYVYNVYTYNEIVSIDSTRKLAFLCLETLLHYFHVYHFAHLSF